MPHYFFNLRTATGAVIRDDRGIEFADLAAARADTERGVRETLTEKAFAGHYLDLEAVEIVDEAGRVLAVVSFAGMRGSGNDPEGS